MSFKNTKSRIFDNQNTRNNLSYNNLIDSYISLNEIKKHPEISSIFRNDKKIHFRILSDQKPKIINIKGIKDKHKQKFVKKINSFKKLYFNVSRAQGFSMKKIKTLRDENNYFSKNYKIIQEKSDENKKEKFIELKDVYEKKNYYVPSLHEKNNLFRGNLLLNNNNLQNFVLNDSGFQKSRKSIIFLEKFKKEVIKKIKLNEKEPNYISYKNSLSEEYRTKFNKIIKDKINEIEKSKSEIKKLRNTINSIGDIDFFFNSENKQYLNKLKNEDIIETTLLNNPIDLIENNKFKNILKKNLYYKYQIKNSDTSLDNLNLIDNNSKDINSFNSEKDISTTYLLPLKNDKNNSILSNIKKINYKIFSRNNTLPISPSKVDNSDKKMIKIIPIKSILRTRRSTIRKNSIYFKNDLERLYNKISKGSNNTFRFNNQIKNYLISKNFSFEEKKDINFTNLSNDIDVIRKKICKSKIIKDDIFLRRIIGISEEKINKLNESDLNLKKNVNKTQEKMIILLSNFNNSNNLNT